jgi:hypothetical protein
MKSNRVLTVLVTSLLLSMSLAAQDVATDADRCGRERFAPLAWLEGEWQGYGKFSRTQMPNRSVWFFDPCGMCAT